MANFHTNMLTIVADEENMMKVMLLFWENYENAAEESGFHELLPERLTLRNLWELLRMQLDQWYEYAFRTDYLGSEGSQTVSETITDGGTMVGVSVAPRGRPYGDAATVDLVAAEPYYIFHMRYSTAWISNFDHDVYDFMERLPMGEYGIAFLDTDEYDRYESISAQYYLWHGQGKAEKEDEFEIDAHDLKARFDELITPGVDNLDLADRALVEDIRQWMNDSDFDDYRDGGGMNEDDSFSYGLAYMDWNEAGAIPLLKAWPDVLRELDEFPLLTSVTGTAYQEREKNIETLVAGDDLILKSDWKSPYFTPVGIEVFTADGRSIGNLEDPKYRGSDFLGDEKRIAFALALPHIRAVVQEVEPLFMRRKNARYSQVLIRLDLEVLDWDGLEREVEEMLSQSPAERVRESHAEGGGRA